MNEPQHPPAPPLPPQHPPAVGNGAGPGQVVVKPQPRAAGPVGAAGPEGKGRRNQRMVALAIAAAVLVVATVVVLIVSLGSGQDDGGPEEVAEHPIVGDGGGDGGTLDFDTSGTTTAPVGDPAATGTADPAAGGDPAAAATPAPGAPAGGGGGAGVLVPRAGDYTYKGTGSERYLPLLPTPIAQGPTKPASVTHTGGGCWRLTIEQNANHIDSATFCAGGDGSLVLQSIAVRQVTDLGQLGRITSNLTTSCPTPVTMVSPGMAPGATFPLNCTNHTEVDNAQAQAPADVAANGTVAFVGVENVTVGGVAVAAYHVHQNVRLLPSDGAPEGSRESEVWIATDDGMVLREVRSMTASAKLFGVLATFTETSEHTLTSR